MMYGKKPAGKASFKPCAGCPSPAKCMKMGKCMKKEMAKKKK